MLAAASSTSIRIDHRGRRIVNFPLLLFPTAPGEHYLCDLTFRRPYRPFAIKHDDCFFHVTGKAGVGKKTFL
jgi:hypothetical protein